MVSNLKPFTMVPEEVTSDSSLSHVAYRVLSVLIGETHRNGLISLTNGEIGQRAGGMGLDSVKKALKELESGTSISIRYSNPSRKRRVSIGVLDHICFKQTSLNPGPQRVENQPVTGGNSNQSEGGKPTSQNRPLVVIPTSQRVENQPVTGGNSNQSEGGKPTSQNRPLVVIPTSQRVENQPVTGGNSNQSNPRAIDDRAGNSDLGIPEENTHQYPEVGRLDGLQRSEPEPAKTLLPVSASIYPAGVDPQAPNLLAPADRTELSRVAGLCELYFPMRDDIYHYVNRREGCYPVWAYAPAIEELKNAAPHKVRTNYLRGILNRIVADGPEAAKLAQAKPVRGFSAESAARLQLAEVEREQARIEQAEKIQEVKREAERKRLLKEKWQALPESERLRIEAEVLKANPSMRDGFRKAPVVLQSFCLDALGAIPQFTRTDRPLLNHVRPLSN